MITKELEYDDKPLYSSTKDEPLTSTEATTLLTTEPIDIKVNRVLPAPIPEPDRQVDFGNGLYALKPNIPVKTLNSKPLYIDIEKLLKNNDEIQASEIITKVQDNTIDDQTLQTLILDGTISDEQPIKAKQKKTVINNFVNFIYNLIFA